MENNLELNKLVLVVDKEVFKKELVERIKLGKGILQGCMPSDDKIWLRCTPRDFMIQSQETDRDLAELGRLEQYREAYVDWDDCNILWLQGRFRQTQTPIKYNLGYSNATTRALPSEKSFQEEIAECRFTLYEKINVLKRLINKIPLLTSEVESSSMNKTQMNKTQVAYSNEIFVVHGHDEAVKEKVARFLEKLGLNPIILHEQVNAGKTIIEKFESHANVGFAVILLTGDDVGKVKNAANDSPRARQNVILEWGFFIGKLGRNRVCALYEKGVELPSDLHGLLYLSLDGRGWQMDLAKELKAAGYKIDLNKLL